MNQVKNTTTLLEYHKNRLECLESIVDMRERLEAILAPFAEEERVKIEGMGDGEFDGYSSHSLASQVKEVMPSYPPKYIVGPTIFDSGRVIMT